MINIRQTHLDKPPGLSRIERKFFVPPRNIGLAYALLRQYCHPDREFPAEQVNSLYFDTDDLEQYLKSASGESRKNKVRLRWYHALDHYRTDVPVFVELKSRDGFTSNKQRQLMPVPVSNLRLAALNDGIVPRTTLMETIAGFDYYPERPLEPVIVISYWRYRFVEMLTGMRVSLDRNIRSTVVRRSLGYGERELPLAGGVIEVKGQRMELPVTLRRMRLLDLDWSRFSKYSSCLDAHLTVPGTIAWQWPSGRTNET
jgi:hypothetical protein